MKSKAMTIHTIEEKINSMTHSIGAGMSIACAYISVALFGLKGAWGWTIFSWLSSE